MIKVLAYFECLRREDRLKRLLLRTQDLHLLLVVLDLLSYRGHDLLLNGWLVAVVVTSSWLSLTLRLAPPAPALVP